MSIDLLNDIYSQKIVVATYPRSGTTWMVRTLVCLYNGQYGEINSNIYNCAKLKINENDYVGFVDEPEDKTTVIKTHMKFLPYCKLGLGQKVVNVFRDCRDVMISYYFYTQSRLWKRDDCNIRFDNEEFSLFLHEHLEDWMDHTYSWLRFSGNRAILSLAYEELKKDYPDCLRRIVDFVGIPTKTTLKKCWKSLVGQQKFGQSPSDFFRKGKYGDWKNYYTAQHKNHVRRVAGDFLIELGYEKDKNW